MASDAVRARRERERARQQRQQLKRERRLAGHDTPPDDRPRPSGSADQGDILARLAELHQRYAADQVDFDEFEQAKADLLAQLDI